MTTPEPPAPPGAPAPRLSPAGRLGQGELRRQVAAHLAASPAGAFTPVAIAKALNRSAGATGNALATLATRGEAERIPGKPARYRATPATEKAAAAAPSAGRAASPTRPRPAPPVPARPPAPASPVLAARPGKPAYRPRALADMPDVAALQALRAAGIPALLYGPPGTGKTSLVEAAFPDVITVAGDGDTTVADFVGEYTQRPDGSYEFVHGPLIRAMTGGAVLLIDDATLISPQVLAVVYPAMDGRRQVGGPRRPAPPPPGPAPPCCSRNPGSRPPTWRAGPATGTGCAPPPPG